MSPSRLAILAAACLLLCATHAQEAVPANATLLAILTPTLGGPLNAAARAAFPISIRGFETPLTIRFVYLNALSLYEVAAACHPTALSFFGVRDSIPPSFCAALPRVILFSYLNHRLNAEHFPLEAAPFAAFLRQNGLFPDDRSTNRSTLVGWANIVANRANAYLSTDGWNSLGDVTRSLNRRPYFDSTGYRPRNLAEQPASELEYPLRWQPLTVSSGFTGAYKSQVHVLPQLGLVKPLVLTPEEVQRKRVSSPYKAPNARKSVRAADRRILERLIDQFFRTSRRLTLQQRFLARWWENKFFSLGSFVPVYEQLLGLDTFTGNVLYMMEVIAEHDALIVAWKEKVRHDLVRPKTIITRLRGAQKVRAFLGETEGVGQVRADEYEPVVPIQPHSEFPSASAVLCTAVLDGLDFGLRRLVGKDRPLPRYVLSARPGQFPFPFTQTVVINVTLAEAVKSCGQSRLYAGVHFSPSVAAGEELGRGIGRKAYLQMEALAAGRVPENCARCKANL